MMACTTSPSSPSSSRPRSSNVSSGEDVDVGVASGLSANCGVSLPSGPAMVLADGRRRNTARVSFSRRHSAHERRMAKVWALTWTMSVYAIKSFCARLNGGGVFPEPLSTGVVGGTRPGQGKLGDHLAVSGKAKTSSNSKTMMLMPGTQRDNHRHMPCRAPPEPRWSKAGREKKRPNSKGGKPNPGGRGKTWADGRGAQALSYYKQE